MLGAAAEREPSCDSRRTSRLRGTTPPGRQEGELFGGPGSGGPSPLVAFLLPDGWVLLGEPVWSLHPVPNLQSKLALGPLVSLHPVTSSPARHLLRRVRGHAAHRGSLPAPRGRAQSSERAERDRAGLLGAGCPRGSPGWEQVASLGVKSVLDLASSADSPLGKGCHFPSIWVPRPCAPTVIPHTSVAPRP